MAGPLAVAAAVALAAWLGAVAVLLARTRTRPVRAGPPTLDLGPEPPAVVNALVNRGDPGRESVAATLLDLAARRVVELYAAGPGHLVVQLRARPVDSLAPFERRLLTRVSDVAHGGVVPVEALSAGEGPSAERWWAAFLHEVVQETRERGLSAPRWTPATRVGVAAAAGVPAVLGAAAVAAGSPTVGGGAAAVLANGLWALLAWAALARLRGEQLTPAGAAAAGAWLGVRRGLVEQTSLAEAPAASVAVWERLLAYGAALGVAGAAVRALSFTEESERWAWSSAGGRWRRVEIRYPRAVPPGWGGRPVVCAVTGAAQVVLAGVLAWGLAPLLGRFSAELWRLWRETDAGVVLVPAALMLATCAGAIVALAWRGASMLVAGVADARPGRAAVVEGQVLRVRVRRDHNNRPVTHVAVDDGRDDVVRAWRVGRRPPGLGPGDRVRAAVTPRLGHVAWIEVQPATERETAA